MPKNRQYNSKTKYPDKVTKPKCLVFVRIFLFSSVGIKIQYFPTAPNYLVKITYENKPQNISFYSCLLPLFHPYA